MTLLCHPRGLGAISSVRLGLADIPHVSFVTGKPFPCSRIVLPNPFSQSEELRPVGRIFLLIVLDLSLKDRRVKYDLYEEKRVHLAEFHRSSVRNKSDGLKKPENVFRLYAGRILAVEKSSSNRGPSPAKWGRLELVVELQEQLNASLYRIPTHLPRDD